jgi:hypothetical protein
MLRRLLILLAFVPLAGCFDFGEDVWINPDGSAKLRVSIGLPEGFFAGADDSTAAAGRKEMHDQFSKQTDRLRALPGVTGATMRDTTEGGTHRFMMDVDVKSYTDLSLVHDSLFADSSEGLGEGSGHGGMKVGLKIDAHDRSLGVTFVTGKTDSAPAAADDSLASSLARSLFGERGFMLRLHAPKIVRATGKIDSAATTVEWSIPIYEVSGNDAPRREMHADVELPAPTGVSLGSDAWKRYGLLALLVVLIFVVGIVIGRRGKKRAAQG